MNYRYTVHYRYLGVPGTISFYSSKILDFDELVQSANHEIMLMIDDFNEKNLNILDFDNE